MIEKPTVSIPRLPALPVNCRYSPDVSRRRDWPSNFVISPITVDLAGTLVRRRYAELTSDAVPARLRVGALSTQPAGPSHDRVTTYSPYDPLVIPTALGDALRCFDGRPVRSALTAAAKEGIQIEGAVVRRLVDFGVLVADEKSTMP